METLDCTAFSLHREQEARQAAASPPFPRATQGLAGWQQHGGAAAASSCRWASAFQRREREHHKAYATFGSRAAQHKQFPLQVSRGPSVALGLPSRLLLQCPPAPRHQKRHACSANPPLFQGQGCLQASLSDYATRSVYRSETMFIYFKCEFQL